MVDVVLAALAAWRLANDFANEHGPFGLFRWFRLGVRGWAEGRIDASEVEDVADHPLYSLYIGVACLHCLSFWAALAVVLALVYLPGARWVVLWLAVGGAVGLLNKAVQKWLI